MWWRSADGHRRSPLWIALGGSMLLIGLGTISALDLPLSSSFYAPTASPAWYLGSSAPWSWLYHYGAYPAVLMAIGAALVLLVSLGRHVWVGCRRHCLMLVLAVVLGPGLLVNGLLKPLWGRPRPRQIIQFGGSRTYHPWWWPAGPGAGTSFPSGHASMGYILVAGASLLPRRRSWLYGLGWGGALGYGTLVGLARLVQGAHFASDVVWAGGLMCLVVAGLQRVLGVLPHRDELT